MNKCVFKTRGALPVSKDCDTEPKSVGSALVEFVPMNSSLGRWQERRAGGERDVGPSA